MPPPIAPTNPSVPVTPSTPMVDWNIVFAANSTVNTAFAVPTVVASDDLRSDTPTNGIMWFTAPKLSLLQFAFFGTGAADATFTATILGARAVRNNSVMPGELVLPEPLTQVTGLLGTWAGAAFTAISNTNRFADTLTLAEDTSIPTLGASVLNKENWMSRLWVDPAGCQLIGVHLQRGTATSMNALITGI